MKEDVYDIGMAIQRHIDKEKANYTRVPAIGRAYCSLDSTYKGKESARQFWVVIGDTRKTLQTDGTVVHRDSKMGEVLTKYHSGTRNYTQMMINPRRYIDLIFRLLTKLRLTSMGMLTTIASKDYQI